MRDIQKYVPGSVVYFATILVVLTVFFELWRLILLIALSNHSPGVPFGVLAQSFLVGLRFDFAISCYATALLALIGGIPPFDRINHPIARVLNRIAVAIVAGITFFVQLVDIEFFGFFNYRLNGQALAWQDTPGFVLPMVWESYPVIRWMLLYATVLALFVLVVRRLERGIVRQNWSTKLVTRLVWLPVLAGVLILGMRGRIEEKAPLRWGAAYFSSYDFANQLALNPNFTLFRDLIWESGSERQVDRIMHSLPQANDARHMLSVLGRRDINPDQRLYRQVTFEMPPVHKYNVVLVIMESFGSSLIGALDALYRTDLTPQFDSLAAQGTLFTNFYSNGMHTYTGLFSTLYGHPTIPGRSVMKRDYGRRNFWGLPSILRDHGYATMFFTTHDPQFDNMQGFLMANGISRVFSLFDYEPSEKLSTLGVPDHVMFDHAIDILRDMHGQPYFATLLTGSNHGPWILPEVDYGPLSDAVDRSRQLNAAKYSDWALGTFCRTLLNDPAFERTLIVVTADNGLLFKPVVDFDPSLFRIPLLIIDRTDNSLAGSRIGRLGSQIDILPTVMGRLQLDYVDYSFGRDLLSESHRAPEFALFSEGFRVGYVENDDYLIWRHDALSSLYQVIDGRLGPPIGDTQLRRRLETNALTLFGGAYEQVKLPLVHTSESQVHGRSGLHREAVAAETGKD